MNEEENNIKDKNNYNLKLNESFEIVCKKYIESINYYILHSKLNIKTTNYMFLKGISISTNVFKLILYYTKNLDLTIATCNRGIFYYIEYINQINEKDNDFLFVQLNLKDAINYVYRKTIFYIDDNHKKTIVNNESEKNFFDTFSIFTNFYIKIVHNIFNSINITLIDENELDSNLLNLYHTIINIIRYKNVLIQKNVKNDLINEHIEKNKKILDYLLNTSFNNENLNEHNTNIKYIINNICLKLENYTKDLII